VPAEEAKKLAEERGLRWIETSAKSNANVEKVFDMCLEEIEKALHPNDTGAKAPASNQKEGCIVM
jgi:Ras family protein